MGLLKLFADWQTATKIDDKYGLGATLMYLDESDKRDAQKRKARNANQLEINKEKVIQIIQNIMKESKDVLTKEQRDELLNYVDKFGNCNERTINFYIDELQDYIDSLYAPLMLQNAAKDFREQVAKFSEEDLPFKEKKKIFNYLDEIKDSTSVVESKMIVHNLIDYCDSIHFNILNKDETLKELDKL